MKHATQYSDPLRVFKKEPYVDIQRRRSLSKLLFIKCRSFVPGVSVACVGTDAAAAGDVDNVGAAVGTVAAVGGSSTVVAAAAAAAAEAAVHCNGVAAAVHVGSACC